MRPRVLLPLALLLALCAGAARAQSALGEIQDKGARKLGKDEVVRLLRGATVRGINASGSEISIDYKADWTIIGAVLPDRSKGSGAASGIYGTWVVEDSGRLCVDATKVIENQTQQACGFYFKLGNQYFVSPSDSDGKARLLKRTIERR